MKGEAVTCQDERIGGLAADWRIEQTGHVLPGNFDGKLAFARDVIRCDRPQRS
jgi:hypothetical protein